MNLFKKGWGLFLGEPSDQAREIAGTLEYVQIKIRFFAPVIAFIEEGEKRHISQVIDRRGKPAYIDYSFSLPSRSLNEFCRWVNQFFNHAQVIEPPHLVECYRKMSQQIAKLYADSEG